ncbi:phage terminase large subunit [Clostridium sp. LP20]|uniref:phage terminase large subunit n=1 Tax=Clostridium sp. LP20 TaxID=3418665 RepID=UPI003EE6834A
MNKKEILLEQLTLELCRKDFWEYCKYIDSDFFNDKMWHLKKIADAFQEIADGKLKKLAVSIAPRAGKSYITSMFCAWMLGRDVQGSIMRNSYASTLAQKFSRDIRDGILQKPAYKKIFPNVAISRLSSAVDAWSLEGNTQPSYFCAGTGGAITGVGCKTVAILDDPIKNIEEALSPTVIESVWNWYTSTHLSRLEKGCAEIHIATRWSSKDPIGRLTDKYGEFYIEDMKVICIPALIDGKSYCEEVKTTEEYAQIKKVTPDFIWEAEYMQNPVETKGLLYNPSTLKRFKKADIKGKSPDGIIAFGDTADKGTDSLSFPVGLIYGKDVYVKDVVFTQEPVEISEPLVAGAIIRNKVEAARFEANNGGHQYSRNIRRLIEGESDCVVISKMNMQNKETRILMESGYVKEHFYFLDTEDIEPGSDYDRFFRELTSYMRLGKNPHDDATDSITGLSEYSKTFVCTPKSENQEEYDPIYGYDPEDEYDEMVKEITGGNINDEIFDWS